jgi:hypothetical protein
VELMSNPSTGVDFLLPRTPNKFFSYLYP